MGATVLLVGALQSVLTYSARGPGVSCAGRVLFRAPSGFLYGRSLVRCGRRTTSLSMCPCARGFPQRTVVRGG